MDENEVDNIVVIYVDENDGARQDFYADAFFSEKFSEVVVLAPRPALSEMLEDLMAYNFDALVSDFRLADASPVEYDGNELVQAFSTTRKGFPCFIRTSFDDDALHVVDDVNLVYSKENGGTDSGRAGLFDRVVLQVQRQRERLEKSVNELERLMERAPDELTSHEVDRVVELDSYIEGYMGADHQAANSYKRSLFVNHISDRQSNIIADTERLIVEIRRVLNGG